MTKIQERNQLRDNFARSIVSGLVSDRSLSFVSEHADETASVVYVLAEALVKHRELLLELEN